LRKFAVAKVLRERDDCKSGAFEPLTRKAARPGIDGGGIVMGGKSSLHTLSNRSGING
jgi:hypothetical protein